MRSEETFSSPLTLRASPSRPSLVARRAARKPLTRRSLLSEEALIKAGCIVTSSTDNYRGEAPEFERAPKAELNFPGIGTLLSIEGLVELGMTPSQAMGMKEGSVIDVRRLRLQPPCPNSCPR